ncbi:MAG: hypothetical protein IPK83_07900 [Planctomycetes bacterium]|nr:hypothetical protein [Planctomycetota bacterium]
MLLKSITHFRSARWCRVTTLAVLIGLVGANAAKATNFPESEGATGNSTKANANVIPFDMVDGDTITGTTTGTTTAALGSSLDYFRLHTAADALGIYMYRLTITPTVGDTGTHVGSIRGLDQDLGVILAVEAQVQGSTTGTVPPKSNVWYGFGKQEELYYRVAGASTTPNPYTVTLSKTPVVPTAIGPFVSGPITITTEGATTLETEIQVFDANLDPIPCYNNDDTYLGSTNQSTLTRNYTPGTYYLVVASGTGGSQAGNLATHLPAAKDDDTQDPEVMDFPNSFVRQHTIVAAQSWDFNVIDGNGTTFVDNESPANFQFQVNWHTFTVVPAVNPPSNDDCAAAIPLTNQAYTVGTTANATHSTTATCDTNVASRDVWYSFTEAHAGTLTVDTCGACGNSDIDTALAIYSGSCGSLTQVACNDDSAGMFRYEFRDQRFLPAGTHYIRVSDKGLAAGGFGLHVYFVPNADTCAGAIVFSPPFNDIIDISTATNDPDISCNAASNPSARSAVWYTITPTSDCALGIAENSTANDIDITVWSGSCGGLSEVQCTANESTVQSLDAGIQYWIEFSLHNTTTSPTTVLPSVPLDVSFSCLPPLITIHVQRQHP